MRQKAAARTLLPTSEPVPRNMSDFALGILNPFTSLFPLGAVAYKVVSGLRGAAPVQVDIAGKHRTLLIALGAGGFVFAHVQIIGVLRSPFCLRFDYFGVVEFMPPNNVLPGSPRRHWRRKTTSVYPSALRRGSILVPKGSIPAMGCFSLQLYL